MNVIFFALANTLIWTFLTVRWKNLRLKGLSPLSSYGLVSAGLPLWIITLIIMSQQYSIVHTSKYILLVVLWIAPVIISNLSDLYLIKLKPLSELKVYKFAFAALIGVLVDLLIFKTAFSYFTIIAISLFFTSGIFLSRNGIKKISEISLSKELLILLSLSIISVIMAFTYKAGLLIQSHPVVHGMILQISSHTILLAISFSAMRKDFFKGILKVKDLFIFGFLVYIYTVFEAFIFKALPASTVIMLGILNLVIFAAYDLKKGEFRLTPQIYIAGALAIAGIIVTGFI